MKKKFKKKNNKKQRCYSGRFECALQKAVMLTMKKKKQRNIWIFCRDVTGLYERKTLLCRRKLLLGRQPHHFVVGTMLSQNITPTYYLSVLRACNSRAFRRIQSLSTAREMKTPIVCVCNWHDGLRCVRDHFHRCILQHRARVIIVPVSLRAIKKYMAQVLLLLVFS